MILQGIIGTIAIGMATGRMWWYKIKSLFSSNHNQLNEDQDKSEAPKEI
jgi:hypothetical protein